MKKIIITSAIALTTLTASFATDLLEVTKLNYSNNKTAVTFVRSFQGMELFNIVNTYNGTLSMQEAVTKGSYIADENITVTGKNASSTKGQVNFFAKLRSDAWYKGLNNYFIELTRQNNLAN